MHHAGHAEGCPNPHWQKPEEEHHPWLQQNPLGEHAKGRDQEAWGTAELQEQHAAEADQEAESSAEAQKASRLQKRKEMMP